MNNKQLQYIREKQKENIYVLPTIRMRKNIDNSITEELEVIYNPDIANVETEFKTSLNDVSLSNDFLEDTKMIQVIRQHGAEVILIYMYLHTKMCKEGYKIVWNDMQKDVVCASLFGIYKIEFEKIDIIINALIDNKLLFLINDGAEQWITSAYQIYMFERVSAKRVRDRIYKKNQALKKEDKIKVETIVPIIAEDDVFGDVPNDAFMVDEQF